MLHLVVIDFLPSWFGTGFRASISVSDNGEGDDARWSDNGYDRLVGVAVARERKDAREKPVVARLTGQGVMFLTLDAARDYLNGEGAYWAFRQGHAHVASDLAPRTPTLMEKLRWTTAKPETPLHDRLAPSLKAAVSPPPVGPG